MIHRNFTAELHCRHGQVGTSRWLSPSKPDGETEREGWLLTEAAYQHPLSTFVPLTFHFEYLKEKQTATRSHYRISCLNNFTVSSFEYAGARMEQNYKGWLGLYGTGLLGKAIDSITRPLLGPGESLWKIETLTNWDGNPNSAPNIPFYLRDALGHRVSQLKIWGGAYLNAGELNGEILEFRLQNIQDA